MDSRRFALIENADISSVRSYLPDNYSVAGECKKGIVISGEDSSGWTLDDYVIPRLASGLIFAREISSVSFLYLVRRADWVWVGEECDPLEGIDA